MSMWLVVLEPPHFDDSEPIEDIEWVTFDDVDAWCRVFELVRRFRDEAYFWSARRDVWVTNWGTLREGVVVQFRLPTGEFTVVRVGVELCDLAFDETLDLDELD